MYKDTVFNIINDSGLQLEEDAMDKLEIYVDLLIKSNRSINLISPGDIPDIWRRHILDSLSPLLLGIINQRGLLVDVGSGAGLPGIPLAIAAPKLSVIMIESTGKKARFIERVIDRLDIVNARVFNTRIEDYEIETKFDYCVCRAFSSILNSLHLFPKMTKRAGRIIFYKGPGVESEIEKAAQIASNSGLKATIIKKTPPEISPEGFSLVVYRRT